MTTRYRGQLGRKRRPMNANDIGEKLRDFRVETLRDFCELQEQIDAIKRGTFVANKIIAREIVIDNGVHVVALIGADQQGNGQVVVSNGGATAHAALYVDGGNAGAVMLTNADGSYNKLGD